MPHPHPHHRAMHRGQPGAGGTASGGGRVVRDPASGGQGPTGTRIRLRRHALAPRVARRLERHQAEGVCPAVLVERCALVAGELVTTALRRTSGVVEFSVEIEAGAVTLRVRDRRPRSTLAAGSDPWAGCRHGREITTRLAQSWGYARDESGAELWAILRHSAQPSPTRAA